MYVDLVFDNLTWVLLGKIGGVGFLVDGLGFGVVNFVLRVVIIAGFCVFIGAGDRGKQEIGGSQINFGRRLCRGWHSRGL